MYTHQPDRKSSLIRLKIVSTFLFFLFSSALVDGREKALDPRFAEILEIYSDLNDMNIRLFGKGIFCVDPQSQDSALNLMADYTYESERRHGIPTPHNSVPILSSAEAFVLLKHYPSKEGCKSSRERKQMPKQASYRENALAVIGGYYELYDDFNAVMFAKTGKGLYCVEQSDRPRAIQLMDKYLSSEESRKEIPTPQGSDPEFTEVAAFVLLKYFPETAACKEHRETMRWQQESAGHKLPEFNKK